MRLRPARHARLARRLELAGGDRGRDLQPGGRLRPRARGRSGLDATLRDALRRRLPALPPGGLTLVHVDDVAAGHLAAHDRGTPGERYILADGFVTAKDLVSTAVAEAGRGRVPPTMPAGLAKAIARVGEAVSRVINRPPILPAGQLHFLLWQARADSTKAREELGVDFRPWQEGIPQAVRWMLDSGRA